MEDLSPKWPSTNRENDKGLTCVPFGGRKRRTGTMVGKSEDAYT